MPGSWFRASFFVWIENFTVIAGEAIFFHQNCVPMGEDQAHFFKSFQISRGTLYSCDSPILSTIFVAFGASNNTSLHRISAASFQHCLLL